MSFKEQSFSAAVGATTGFLATAAQSGPEGAALVAASIATGIFIVANSDPEDKVPALKTAPFLAALFTAIAAVAPPPEPVMDQIRETPAVTRMNDLPQIGPSPRLY